MSEPNTSSGPILQLLANGLNLWIRRQCDEVSPARTAAKPSAAIVRILFASGRKGV